MYEESDSMESSPTYSKGDIVWVKLSSIWWPGEVINEGDLPDDLMSEFKKPPLVIVKFFDEDSYEYVKNWSNIHPYNYQQKTEFIKKGMAGFRSKLSHMSKFPKDVGIAEDRTNGNPNILSQPEFLPVKKINYDEIFGTPSPKKSAKGKTSLPSTKKTPSRDSNQPHITHRRFLGNDDYRAYICIQYPGKDRNWDSDDEEIKKLDEEPQDELKCQSCNFKTRRLEVMVLHTKMHIQGLYVSAKRKSNKKTKDLGISDSDSDIPVTKSPKIKQRKKKEVKPAVTDIFNNLLEEWNDTDEETEEIKKKPTKAKKKATEAKKVFSDSEKEEDQENKSTKKESPKKSEIKEPAQPQSSNKNTYDDIKNCFDFDEDDEEEEFLMPTTTVGRKIPRVIPEKPKTNILELLEQSDKEEELERASGDGESKKETAGPATKSVENGNNELNKKEILRISQSFNRSPTVEENFETTFKELMDETELPPSLEDDLAQNLKPEQNFHDARAIKFPDKGGTSSTKAKGGTSSKKRFVTSFEDFEAGFRKIGDEEQRSRQQLTSDKEVRSAKTPEAIQKNAENTAQTSAKPSHVREVNVETITSPEKVPEVPESLTDKKSPARRKTRQSDPEKFKESEELEVPVDSKRKSRRRTKQFVIEEDFEEIIEISMEKDSFDNSTEQIINLMDDKAKEKLAAIDSEIEALKRTLESPLITMEEVTIDVLTEGSAESALLKVEEAQAKETETIGCDTPVAIDAETKVAIQDDKSKKKTAPTKATPSKTGKKRRSKESEDVASEEAHESSRVDTADKERVIEERRGRSRGHTVVDSSAKEEKTSTITKVDVVEKQLDQLVEPVNRDRRGRSKGHIVDLSAKEEKTSTVTKVDAAKKELDQSKEPVIKERRGRSRGRTLDLNVKEDIKSTTTKPEVSKEDVVEKELDEPKELIIKERRGRSRGRTVDLNAKEDIKSAGTKPEVSKVDMVEKELDQSKEPVIKERRGRSRGRTIDLNAKEDIKSAGTKPEVSKVDMVEKELDQSKEPVIKERRGRSRGRTIDLNAKEDMKSTVTKPDVSKVDVVEKEPDQPKEPVIKERRGRSRGRTVNLNAKEDIKSTVTKPDVSKVDVVEKELHELIEPEIKERRGRSRGHTVDLEAKEELKLTVAQLEVSSKVEAVEQELNQPKEPLIKDRRGRSRGRTVDLNTKEDIESTEIKPDVSKVDLVEKELDQPKEPLIKERRGRSKGRTVKDLSLTVKEPEADVVEEKLGEAVIKEKSGRSRRRTVDLNAKEEITITVTETDVSKVDVVKKEHDQLIEPVIKERKGRSRGRPVKEPQSTVTEPDVPEVASESASVTTESLLGTLDEISAKDNQEADTKASTSASDQLQDNENVNSSELDVTSRSTRSRSKRPKKEDVKEENKKEIVSNAEADPVLGVEHSALSENVCQLAQSDPTLSSSVSEVLEVSTPKPRRGRSQKFTQEELTDVEQTFPIIEEQTVELVSQNVEIQPFETNIVLHEEHLPKTRKSKQSKLSEEKEQSISAQTFPIIEEQTVELVSQNVEIQPFETNIVLHEENFPKTRKGRQSQLSEEKEKYIDAQIFPTIEEQTVELVGQNVEIQPFENNIVLHEEHLPKTKKGRQSKLSEEKEQSTSTPDENISNTCGIQPKESLLPITTQEEQIANMEQLAEKQTTVKAKRGRPPKHLKEEDKTLISLEVPVVQSSASMEVPNEVPTSVIISEQTLEIPMETKILEDVVRQDIVETPVDIPDKPRRRTRSEHTLEIPLEHTKITEDLVSREKTKEKKQDTVTKEDTSDILPGLQQPKDSTDKLSSQNLVEQTNKAVVIEGESTSKNRRGRPSKHLKEKEPIAIEEQTSQTVIESEEPISLSTDLETQTTTGELKDNVTKPKETTTKSKRGRHKERQPSDVEKHDSEVIVESVVGLEITIPLEHPEEILVPLNDTPASLKTRKDRLSQQSDKVRQEKLKDFVVDHSEVQPVNLDSTASYPCTPVEKASQEKSKDFVAEHSEVLPENLDSTVDYPSVEVSVENNAAVVSEWNDVSHEKQEGRPREESEPMEEVSPKEIDLATVIDLSDNVDSETQVPSVEATFLATNQNDVIETTQPKDKHRKSRMEKHKKEKDTVSHIEEQVSDSLDATKIKPLDAKLPELEHIQSHSSVKESKKSSSKSRKSRHRKRSKEEKVSRKDISIDKDVEINQSKVVMEVEVPQTSQLDNQKDEASLVESLYKVKKSTSRKSTHDETNKETELEVKQSDTVVLGETPHSSTAKSKKGKSRKHKTEVEILYELEKNLSPIKDSKAKEPSSTSAEQGQASESFSKTRRGRSRKLTQEEEDFNRAIKESLKDMAKLPSKVEDTNADFSPETKSIDTDKPSSTAELFADESPRSRRSKSRKHSRAKEHALSISDGNKVETTEVSDILVQSKVDEPEPEANNLVQEVPKKSGRRRRSQLKTHDQTELVLNKEEPGTDLIIAEKSLSVDSQITEIKTDLNQSGNEPSTQATPIEELVQKPKDVEPILEQEVIAKDLENSSAQSSTEIEEKEVTEVEQNAGQVLDVSVSEEPTKPSDFDLDISEKPTAPVSTDISISEEPVAKIRPGKRRRSSKNEKIAIPEAKNMHGTEINKPVENKAPEEVVNEIKAAVSEFPVVQFNEQPMQEAFNNASNLEDSGAIQKQDTVNNVFSSKLEEQMIENQTVVTSSLENKILEPVTIHIVDKDDGASKKAVDQANYFLSSPTESQNSMEERGLSVMEAEDKPLTTQTMMDATCLYKFDSNSMDSTDVNPREIISNMFEKHEPQSDHTAVESLTEADVCQKNVLDNRLNEPSSDGQDSFMKQTDETFATKAVFSSVTADLKELNKSDQRTGLHHQKLDCWRQDDKLAIIESENENSLTQSTVVNIVGKAHIRPVTSTDLNIEREVDRFYKELEASNLFDHEKDKKEIQVISENDSNKVKKPFLDLPTQKINYIKEVGPSYSGSRSKKARARIHSTDESFKQGSDVGHDVIKEFIRQEIRFSPGHPKTKKTTKEKTSLIQAQEENQEVSKTEMEGLSRKKERPRKYSKTENSLSAELSEATLSSVYNDKIIEHAVQLSKEEIAAIPIPPVTNRKIIEPAVQLSKEEIEAIPVPPVPNKKNFEPAVQLSKEEIEAIPVPPMPYKSTPMSTVDNKRHVPPKKSRWSRRESFSKDDNVQIELKEQTAETATKDSVTEQHSVEKEALTVEKLDKTSDLNDNNKPNKKIDVIETNLRNEIQEISTNLNDSEIILPPKKSKRCSETKFSLLHGSLTETSFLDKKSDSDILSFPSCDDSIMSTSLRHNIEGLIKDIDNFDNTFESDSLNKSLEVEKMSVGSSKVVDVKSEIVLENSIPVNNTIKEPSDISKCVPPKKKKIDPDFTKALENNVLTTEPPKIEEKLSEVIPPKRKIQKLFETSQALEKLEKVNDMPQMSPLAKKKSFLFHQEEFRQAEKAEVFLKNESDSVLDLEDKAQLDTALLEGASMKTGEDITCDSKKAKTDEDKGLILLPKKRKKRKSSSHGEHAQKRERRSSSESVALSDGQKEDEKHVSQTESTAATDSDGGQKVLEVPKNETEVKFESDELQFCIQTNLSNLSTSAAEELSAIATATLSEIKSEVVLETSSQVTPVPSTKITTIDDVSVKTESTKIVGVTSEPEYVPIAVTPTVMSEKDLDDAQVEITTSKVISEKKPTNLAMFSMDYLESNQPSHIRPVSNKHLKKEVVVSSSSKGANTTGTEFTSKAITTKEFDNRPLVSQPKAYALKSELLDILEGNSNSSTNSSGSEQKFKTSFDNYDKQTTVQGIFDFEEAIPSQIVLSNKVNPETVLMDSPKLLERLSMANDPSKLKPQPKKVVVQSDIKVSEGVPKTLMTKIPKPVGGTPKPGQKIMIKTTKAQLSAVPKTVGSKPIILSEQIIRPANTVKTTKAPIQPQGVKRQYEDIEDVEAAFIIPKIAKKAVEEESTPAPPEKPARSRGSKASGKAKILQQTIITPKGEIIQPQAAAATKASPAAQIKVAQSQPDELIFDINSMPIVLSDDLLTPESIQNMPVVLSEEVVTDGKPVTSFKADEKTLATMGKKVVGSKQIVFKTTQPGSNTPVHVKHTTKPRILSGAQPGKVPKAGPTTLLATGTSADGKPTKYVLVPSTVTQAISQVKTVKQPMIKKQPVIQQQKVAGGVQTSDQPAAVPVGNKIMIVTNQHGQQTRVVLTPQQQKAFMQGQPGSKTKTIIKGALPKGLLETVPGPSGVGQKAGLSAVPQVAHPAVSTHSGGLLMTVGKGTKVSVQQPKKTVQRTPTKPQKTILIKNQLGQTVRKIQGTDDADLDRQVAEQLEAIKASARLQQTNKSPEIINYTSRPIPSSTSSTKTAVRRTFSKKIDAAKAKPSVSAPHTPPQKSPDPLVPALAPLSPQSRISQIQTTIGTPKQPTSSAAKLESSAPSPATTAKLQDTVAVPQQTTVASEANKAAGAPPAAGGTADGKPPDRPLTQLVIQDGLGNQTTITEGQILAIPSETVDGQPQSYMLVTLDEMGNITPLNNEALMSLDPSLGLGGDLNNMVLQVDQGQGMVAAFQPPEASSGTVEQKKVEERLKPEAQKPAAAPLPEPKTVPVEPPKLPQETASAVEQQIVIGEGILPGADAGGGQQLIVTGDPIATQKFLESLSDGSTDLANILANAEGGSVLIQADGQQILIKTNSAGGGQPLMGIAENSEAGGNPIFGSAHHKPNQDILAAALANTDVFQPSDQQSIVEPPQSPLKGLSHASQQSPGAGAGVGAVLYPMHVGNVLETSLTLGSPIMTPLEVPSGPGKKIDDDVDILNQIPKNVDLPITITDPNISQTVAQQQQQQQQQALGLMELSLPTITETSAADIHSPSYGYSLPVLDESAIGGGASQKPFNGSMPLLTEDVVAESESGTSSSSELGKIRVAKGLHDRQAEFGTGLGSLPMLAEAIELSREEVVKTSGFEDMGSLPMLSSSEDVIEDSGSSIGSTRPTRSSPKAIERDIVDEGLSTLGGEMCSSLSEPPPDMFDLASITGKEEEVSSSDMSSSTVPEPPGGGEDMETVSLHSDNSNEIPLQPPIVADLNAVLKRAAEEEGGRREEKRHKFD